MSEQGFGFGYRGGLVFFVEAVVVIYSYLVRCELSSASPSRQRGRVAALVAPLAGGARLVSDWKYPVWIIVKKTDRTGGCTGKKPKARFNKKTALAIEQVKKMNRAVFMGISELVVVILRIEPVFNLS